MSDVPDEKQKIKLRHEVTLGRKTTLKIDWQDVALTRTEGVVGKLRPDNFRK